jgi:hypothetical protein
MIACMAVYRDFFSYRNGIYRHVTGDLAGYHAICCIGYDEDEQCWICKNSWGEDWGMDGYFKIAYGQADMDSKFAMYGVEGIGGTLRPEEEEEECDWAQTIVIDYSFDKKRYVLWAYTKNEWRYRVLTENQASRLGSWINCAGAVRVCYSGNKIIRILGRKTLSTG